MYATPDELSQHLDREVGLDVPVHNATDNVDLSADLKRDLSQVRGRTKAKREAITHATTGSDARGSFARTSQATRTNLASGSRFHPRNRQEISRTGIRYTTESTPWH